LVWKPCRGHTSSIHHFHKGEFLLLYFGQMFAWNYYSQTKEHNRISNLAKFEFKIIKGCRVIVN
jgi:hypothetical protein